MDLTQIPVYINVVSDVVSALTTLIPSAVTLASVVSALTNKPAESSPLSKPYAVLDAIALNVGKAKNRD